jgi:hypothetical protein
MDGGGKKAATVDISSGTILKSQYDLGLFSPCQVSFDTDVQPRQQQQRHNYEKSV